MLIVAAPDVVRWICKEWDGNLEWDISNTEKLKKHSFTIKEVEEVFAGDFSFAGEVVGEWGERRFLIYSQTSLGRYATVAWTMRKNKVRVISCRGSRKNEKDKYHQNKSTSNNR